MTLLIQSLSFLFALKKVIFEFAHKDLNDDLSHEIYNEVTVKIDALILIAFDIYMKCKSKIFDIRIADVKSRSQRAFELLERQKE